MLTIKISDGMLPIWLDALELYADRNNGEWCQHIADVLKNIPHDILTTGKDAVMED